jgi:dolichyl-phosphate beta-glucosyltransferase
MRATIVVPCYNESGRLKPEEFDRYLAAASAVRILFVDDGSTDATSAVIGGMAAVRAGRAGLLTLPRNRGKAEAVRAGLTAALADGPDVVGFWDADLATPLECLDEFLDVLERRPGIAWVIGARVKLLGRDVRRRAARHYVGRVFATVASLVLRLEIYDTQCGAKLFRADRDLPVILAEPFLARWIFDVEMIARLIRVRRQRGGSPVEDSIYEYPLERWVDIGGSKLRLRDYFKAARDMARIWLSLRKAT